VASAEEIIDQLHGVPLFAALERPQLRELAAITHEIDYAPGAIICRQGEQGERFYIVAQGSVRLSRIDPEGRAMEVQRLEAGASFGETSLLLGDLRDATAEAVAQTTLLYIEKAEFDQLLAEDEEIEPRLQMRRDIAEQRSYPRFPWLDADERPLKVLRRHPAILITVLAIPLTFAALLVLVAILAAAWIGRLGVDWGSAKTIVQVISVAVGVLLALVPLGYSLYLYEDWRNDLYVVTNRRVIHRERIGLIRQQSSAIPLRAIQDIQQVQIGPLSRIFQYGNLIIDTASGRGQVVFNDIHQPVQVRDLIFAQRARLQALARAQEREAIRQAMYRHFLGQEQEEQVGTTVTKEERRLPGCLALPLSLTRSFLPPAWHREGETVTWRKHWVALLRSIFLPMFAFLLTTVALVVWIVTQHTLPPEVVLLYSLAVLILVPLLLWKFEDWQNDFYQVTATRIIDVERSPFFLREEQRVAALEQITSVQFSQSIWGRILGYGNVTVDTAAPAGTFTFDMVSRPQEVQAEIFAHIEAARRLQQQRDAAARQAEMLDWFSVYSEIQSKTRRGKQENE